MANKNEKLNNLPDDIGEDSVDFLGSFDEEEFTLESIIAEYREKGYLENDRTPSTIVEMDTQNIIDSVLNKQPKSEPKPSKTVEAKKPAPVKKDAPVMKEIVIETEAPIEDIAPEIAEEHSENGEKPKKGSIFKKIATFASSTDDDEEEESLLKKEKASKKHEIEENSEISEETSGEPEKKSIFKKLFKKSEAQPEENETTSAFEDEFTYDDDDRYGDHFSLADKISLYINKKREIREEKRRLKESYDADAVKAEGEYVPEEEPPYKEEAKRFANGLFSLVIREYALGLLAILAIVFSAMYQKGSAPFGLSSAPHGFVAMLLIMQIISMGLCIEPMITGVSDILRLSFGAEAILMLSNLFSLIDGFVMLMQKNFDLGLPMSAVCIAAMFFAMLGRRTFRMSMAEAFRMAAKAKKPTAILTDSKSVEGKSVMKKGRHDVSGFRRMAVCPDFSETLFTVAGPFLIIVALILAVITVFSSDGFPMLTHTASSLFAVSASFGAFVAFEIPFRAFSKRAHRSGGALAGWAGVCDVAESDATMFTDNDFFPNGTVSIEDVKVSEGYSLSKIISYAGSIYSASKSDLANAFDIYMYEKGISKQQVRSFAFYQGGGLGGTVNDANVLVGPVAFMNLMGIRIPADSSDKTAIYCAVNGDIAAVFTLLYKPASSVRKAILLLARSRVNVILASKDSNLTPVMIRQRFNLDLNGIQYIAAEECYKLTDMEKDTESDAAGFVTRQGLLPYAAITTYSKRIKNITIFSSILSVVSAFVGLLFVFLLCKTGAFDVSSALNIVLYQLLSQGISYLITFIFTRI